MSSLALLEATRRGLAMGALPPDALADALDRIVGDTLDRVPRPRSAFAVVALGGYGRREMAPGSDVDLQFLVDGRVAKVADFVKACLHAWWEDGLRVGYATRDLDDTLLLARQDLKTATALLDARFVAGDARLVEALRRELDRKVIQPDKKKLLAALIAERRDRHARFGDSVYLLEPDLKLGEGGLRDLHGARWAARIVRGHDDLAVCGLTPTECAALQEAHDTLLRIRVALHAQCGFRKVDRLRFEYQEALATRLGDHDVVTSMQRYWRAASRIRALTRRVLDLLEAEVLGASVPFLRVTVDPTNPFAALRASSERDQPLHPEVHAAIAELVSDAARRRAPLTPTANATRDLLALLTCPTDRAQPLLHALDLGLLPAYVPEFAGLVGRYQHNVFHVYTVDIHTLHGLATLKDIVRLASATGPGAALDPSVALMAGLSPSEREVLFVALLLHDLNKAGLGPEAAEVAARRLGFSDERALRVGLLVREHLLMAQLAQNRDIHDVATVRQLARVVEDTATLAMLTLLTVADTSSANPELLTEWKAALLHELYTRTRLVLEAGLDVFADRDRAVAQRRAEVFALLGVADPAAATLEGTVPKASGVRTKGQARVIDDFLAALPTRYAVVTPAPRVVSHLALLRLPSERHTHTACAREALPDGTSLLSVTCPDSPGLLASLSGTIAAHGGNIVWAEVFSRTDGVALDVFQLAAEPDLAWEALIGDIERVVGNETSADALLARRERVSPLGERPAPPVETRVSVDLGASERYTVIDVEAKDRPGLLYRVTRALFRAGLSIALARIATEGHTARDAFYVEWVTGGKVTDPAVLARITAEVGLAASPQ